MLRKINPKSVMPDPCQRSLDWLEAFATEWFKKNVPQHGQIWFSDENTRAITQSFPNSKLPVEVTLTGSFLSRILESSFWNFEQSRLWTFSPQIKDFLTNVINIDAEKIGIIGRPLYRESIFIPNFEQEVNLVYAGRLSLSKNIPALLKIVSLLQVKYKKNVTLDIFGEFDSFPDESLGKYHVSSLKEITLKTLNDLPWNKVPVFHGDVKQEEWVKVKLSHPVFISLSTSMYEDFGTAAQIAASRGWPSILSSWGGHKSSQNFLSVPYYLIPQTIDLEFIQKAKAESIASMLVQDGFEFITNKSDSSFIPDKFFNHIDYQKTIQQFIRDNSPEILFCFREKMTEFADTPKGINLFKNYHLHFSGSAQSTIALIYDDADNSEAIKELTLPSTSFELIPARHLFSNFYLKRLPQFKEIIFLNLETEMIKKVSHFLTSTLSLKIPIKIYK